MIKTILAILIIFIIVATCDAYHKFKLSSIQKNRDSAKKPDDFTIYENYPIKVMKSRVSGLGVFAARNIKKGELIEECPCIEEDNTSLLLGKISDYLFISDKNSCHSIIAFGYGSLYNHQDIPNAEWKVIDGHKLVITALTDIPSGQEIYISYGNDYWKDRNSKIK